MSSTVTLECQCGACKISTALDNHNLPLNGYMCHCNACRHSHGTLCNMSAILPSELPPATKSLTKYAFSNNLDTFFCATCGSQMYARNHADPEKIMTTVKTGVLHDAGELVNFSSHVYVESTEDGGFADWLHEINGTPLRRFKQRPKGEELPHGWKSSANSTSKGQDKLPAYCHCKGVEFYVTRPDDGSSNLEAPLPDVLEKSAEELKSKLWWLTEHDRYLAGTCACNSCRLAAGVDVVQWAFVPAANIKLSGGKAYRTDFGSLKAYQSREDVTRYFCGRCGANVFWTGVARPDLIDVAVGLFEAPSGARAEDWLCWVKDRVSYEEDAKNQRLVEAVGKGLAAWRDSRQ